MMNGEESLGRAEVQDDREMGRLLRDRDGEERHELPLVLISHSIRESELISCNLAHNLLFQVFKIFCGTIVVENAVTE